MKYLRNIPEYAAMAVVGVLLAAAVNGKPAPAEPAVITGADFTAAERDALLAEIEFLKSSQPAVIAIPAAPEPPALPTSNVSAGSCATGACAAPQRYATYRTYQPQRRRGLFGRWR